MTKYGRRATARCLPLLVLIGGALIVACSSDDPPAQNPQPTPTPPPATFSISPAANAAEFVSPFDATPDPKGENVYFTAIATDTGAPAVFTASAAGGGVRKLTDGAPLVAPFGIAISEDGQKLFIADSGADNGEESGKGAIFSLPVAGGKPELVRGSENFETRGLELDKGALLFTGRNAEGRSGVFKLPSEGGAASVVAVGEPFSAPSGIAIAPDGSIYVADSQSEAGAAVYRIASGSGTAELIKDQIGLGYPAGVALARDASTLFISGRTPGAGTDVVYRVTLSDKNTTTITDTISNFEEAAGLHRAKGADVFAWADRFANNTGTVYVLK